MRFTTEIIESKNRIFIHLDRVNKSSVADEGRIRKQLNKQGIFPGELITRTPDMIVFEFTKMTDLTTSYGSSSLEAAPPEVTDPDPKPKTPRRRRTRKTASKTSK